MTPQRVFKIEKVPKGSHLEKYLKELPEVFNGKKAEILTYLKKMFVECLDFSKQNAGFSYLPQIILKFVTDHEEYRKSEQAESQKAITREESKLQSNAFTVGNRYTVRIYVDLESFVDLLKHGWERSF